MVNYKFSVILFCGFTALLILTLNLSVCSKSKPTGPGHETVPPTILFTNPADTDPSVELNIVIRITFSEPIDTNTIDETTFFVNNGVSGEYSFNGNTVSLTPSQSLTYSVAYTATITTTVTDTVGNHLAENYIWTFTAEANPATTSPTVTSVYPADNALNIAGDETIMVSFSKGMDAATLNASSFSLDNGATGTVTYNNKVATYIPDDTLMYLTDYIATITTAVADTFGNHLESNYSWNFTTGVDPIIPVVTFSNPFDSAIVDDTVTVVVTIDNPVSIDKVEFYVDNVHIAAADDMTVPYEYLLDASSWSIGSVHTISTKAYETGGHIGASDTIDVIYLWQELATDNNSEQLPQDLRRMLYRSTNDVLELRYEFGANWPYAFPSTDEQVSDFIVNLGIYLDTDLNPSTGDQTLGESSIPLNGIGADHQIILSSLIPAGRDSTLRFWNSAGDPPFWDLVYDAQNFDYINAPPDTNFLEFGINWADMNNSYGAYVVSFHAFATVYINGSDTTITYDFDWVPNQGAGFVTVAKDPRYIGAPFTGPKIIPYRISDQNPSIRRSNPFE